MFKRIIFAILVVFALPISAMAEEDPAADPSEQLQQARTYQKDGYLLEAEQIYKTVMIDYEGTVYALRAQRNLVLLYISAKRDNDALAGIDKLIADFPDHPDLPAALYDIARKYQKTQKYEEAKSIYQQIIQQSPDSSYASKSQLNVARMDVLYLIDLGHTKAAQAAIDELTADFGGHPDLPEVLRRIAGKYRDAKKYEEAKSIYDTIITDTIITDFPDSNAALRAQFNIPKTDILSLIDYEDDPNAQAAIEWLIADFNDYKRLPKALRRFAQKYRKAEKYEQAGDIYQQVAQQNPDSNGVTKAQFDTSRMDILSLMEWGDDPNAQEAIESLIDDFNDYQRLPAVLRNFARKYRKANKYEQAEDIYQQVAQHLPDTNDALRAQLDASKMNVLALIDSGDDAGAMSAIDNLIADFNDHPDLPQAVLRVGEQYYRQAFWYVSEGLDDQAMYNFANAIAVWERIITELLESTTTADAYFISAISYQQLCEYEKAGQYYSILVDNWPDYKYASEAKFMIEHRAKDLEGFSTRNPK